MSVNMVHIIMVKLVYTELLLGWLKILLVQVILIFWNQWVNLVVVSKVVKIVHNLGISILI